MAWAPAYITVDELRDYMGTTNEDGDIEMALAVEAASRAVDDNCNRQFGQVAAPEERRYTAWYDYGRRLWVVDVDDLQDATGLAVTIDGAAVDSYTLEPVNAVLEGLAWTRLVVASGSTATPTGARNEVSATGRWGWLAYPDAAVLATKLQGSRFHSRRDSPYGVAGSPQDGSELRLLAKVDPDVAVALRRYRRPRKVG